jgi:putative ABC transport system substrate-binding protein
MPGVVTAGLIVNTNSVEFMIDRQKLEGAGKRLGINLVLAEVREPDDLEAAFRRLSDAHVQVVIVLANALLFQERQRVAALAAAARLPAVYGFRDHVDAPRAFAVRPAMSQKS